ncbi:MAG: prepilin-type N-terminal cleavage/methylation domain-containing protein [bacterium]|nr:prepilin-type N-terminal cleavage/methylation domain-containing protein [bacterium]
MKKFLNTRYKIPDTKYHRGFTLIEILIASAIFAFLIIIVVGIFLGVVSAQRKTVAVRTLQNSAHYAIEAMSRDIRTGFNFSIPGNELRFTSTIGGGNQLVSYRLQNGAIERNALPLTPPNVRVSYLNFYLSGEAPGDQRQPRITMTLGAAAGAGLQETKINVQTTLSQRELQL